MSNDKREPGCYWVKRDAASEWEIVQVHPADDYGQSIDSMGWDAGACLPADAEWGPRILPPDAPPDAGEIEDIERCKAIAREFRVIAEKMETASAERDWLGVATVYMNLAPVDAMQMAGRAAMRSKMSRGGR